MNRRIKKKLQKRGGYHKWVNYRWHRIRMAIQELPGLDKYDMTYCVVSPNNKHISHIYGLTNVRMVGMTGIGGDNHPIETKINFKAVHHPLDTDTENNGLNFSQLLESWKVWLEANIPANKEGTAAHEEADRMDAYRFRPPALFENLQKITTEERKAKFEEAFAQAGQEKPEALLKPHPIVPITSSDIGDALEPCDRYDLMMPKDLLVMCEKASKIRSRKPVILSVFPGIADDLSWVVGTWHLDHSGIVRTEMEDGIRCGNVDVDLLLDRLLEATHDDMKWIIVPWCPGIRLALNTLKTHYAFIRPEYQDRYGLSRAAKATAELNEHPVEIGSFTEYCMKVIEQSWDSFFTDRIKQYENLIFDDGTATVTNPTLIYRPLRNAATGLYQLEDQILAEFNYEWAKERVKL